jgi:hypothetical protein
MAQTSLNSTGVASSAALSLQSNGTTEAIGISTGQVATLAQNPILTSGTVNGLAFLNASKVLTTGSALTFDGTNLGLGVTPSAWKSGAKAFQLGGAGYASLNEQANGSTSLNFNCYESAANTWTYYVTGVAPTRYTQLSGAHAWHNAPSGTAGNTITFTQAMTLDSSGNLGIGTTSVAAAGTTIHVNGSSTDATIRLSNSTTGATVNDGFRIQSNNADVYFVNHEAGFLAFQTSATERARITSNGELLVGTTSSEGPSKLSVVQSTTNQANIGLRHTLGAGETFVRFLNAANSAVIGSITNNANTGVLYNTTSDYRLKENIQDAAPASALIDSLQVRQYDWKSDGTRQRYGFVAQELVTVAPEAVHQPADPEEMMAVDYSKLVPMLVKEIQDLRKRLASAGI